MVLYSAVQGCVCVCVWKAQFQIVLKCVCVCAGCSHFEVHSVWVSFSRCVLQEVHTGWQFAVKL